MKKRNVILASILGASALAVGVTGVIISNSNNQTNSYIEENLSFNESTLAEDGIFAQGFSSDKLEYPVLMAENETSEIVKPKIGCQYAYDESKGKVSIRFFGAIASEKVDAIWTRALYNADGSVNNALTVSTRQSTVAYSKLAYMDGSVLKTKSAIDEEDENGDNPYKYYVIYTITDIPVETYQNCKLRVSLELSNDANTVNSKVGSVRPTSNPLSTIESYDILLDMNNSSGSYGNFTNGKAKTIYKTTDDLDTDNITPYIDDGNNTSYSVLSVTGFEKGVPGKQTLTVNTLYGTANYDVYVVNTLPSRDVQDNYVVTVDKDYLGEIGAVDGAKGNMFTTISQALEFLQDTDRVPYEANKILNIGAGYYREKLEITTANLTINGVGIVKGTYSKDDNYDSDEFASATIIEFDTLYGVKDTNGFTHDTNSTQTVQVNESATNCKMNNLTISNKWNCYKFFDDMDKTDEHRALAILIRADQFVMINCSLLGYQDTIELFKGRQYFYNTFISGVTDFIFGTNNTTLFDHCDIHTIYNGSTDGGYINAFKGTHSSNGSDSVKYGAIYYKCDFTKDDLVTSSNTSIARAWDAYSKVSVIECNLDSHISTAAYTTNETKNQRYVAWDSTGKNAPTLSTVEYVEYNNRGASAVNETQNGMTYLTAAEAADYYDYSVIFGKTNGNVSYSLAWNPYTGLEQDNNTYYIFHSTAPTTGTSYEFDPADCNKTGNYTVGDLTFTNCQRRTAGNDDLYVGGSISFSVEAGTTVTVNSYPGYHAYKIGDKYANVDSVSFYFESAQDVVIERAGGDAFYLYSIVFNSTNQIDNSEYVGVGLSKSSVSMYEGDTLNLSTLKVYAEYSTGYIIYLDSSEYTVSGTVDTNIPGNYSYTYTYNEKSKNLNIEVKENLVEYIAVTNYKGTYGVNSSFDDSMTVTATYSNDSVRVLDDTEYEIDITEVDFSTVGTYPVTVTYKADNTIYKTFNITVSAGKYTVTFMDGENVVSSCTGAAGDSITYPSDTSKSGYQFIRYYLDEDFTKIFDKTVIPDENVVVYLRYMELNKSGITYVSTESELVNAISNQRTIWLTNDIDMTGSTYTGLGNAWAGNINGYGYTISNWTPTYTSNQLGFFGNAYQGTIEDVIFKDCVVSDGGNSLEYLGLLTAGTYDDEIIKNVYLINCSMNTSKSKTIGLIGTVPQAHGNNPSLAITNLVIENCSVAGTQYIGGLFGYVQNSTVISITNSSIDVSCTTSGAKIIGGIAGQIQGSASISVNNSMIDLTIESGNTYIGGVVGYAKAGTINVSNTSIELDISAAYSIGGVAGEVVAADVTVSLSNDYVTGSIVVSNGSSDYENTYVGRNGSSYNYSTCTYSKFTLTGASATFQGTEV
ncbi:MAG: bacterial Ig-like domain-containing protein [Acholeplasmatales bacterium]|nr:bacterial Ig-like domain-containing protein [Acholeplasmatales bacterium]